MTTIENSTFSRLLRLSSDFDVSNSGRSTFFVNNLSRMTETDKIIRAVCKSVSFVNNAYNIYTEGVFKNNVFNWDVEFGVSTNNHSYTVTEAGFYTAQQLIDILKPVIEATLQAIIPAVTLTMEIGTFSKKIEYSLSTVGVALVLGGQQGIDGLNKALGNNEDSGQIVSPNTYVSDSLPNLSGLQNVYVHSTTLSEGNLVDGDVENHDVIAEVPVDVPYAVRVNYESRDDELDSVNYASLRNFDSVAVSLRDINNNEIELNGGNVIIVLKIYYL